MILSGRALPANYFRRFIDEMVSALGTKLAKFPINAVIGNMGKKETGNMHKAIFVQTYTEACYYYDYFQKEGWKAAFVKRFDMENHGFDLYQITAAQFIKSCTEATVRNLRFDWVGSYVEILKSGSQTILVTHNLETKCFWMWYPIKVVAFLVKVDRVPSYLWNILYAYKMRGCKFYLFGDYRQLPPVEPEEETFDKEVDYLDTKLVATLADGNQITLTVNHRHLSDPTNNMRTIVDEVEKGIFKVDDYMLHKVEDVLRVGYTNVTFTNAMRKFINSLHMENLKKNNHKASLTLPYMNGDKDTQ
ncbi:hypothetical protein HDU87_003393, partial [Geranomyces variabilis]